MAEILGIIASSLQLAGLAGKIITVGLQIRTLCNDIQNASDDVATRLQEIETLSEILQHSSSISPNAASFCQSCLSELHMVLDELELEMKRSSGVRRKLASTKLVLKKDTIQRLDGRLRRSLKLLELANQGHISLTLDSLHQHQHQMFSAMQHNHTIMMSLLKHPSGPSQVFGDSVPNSTVGLGGYDTEGMPIIRHGTRDTDRLSSASVKDSRVWRSTWSSSVTSWTFGLRCVTGAVFLERRAERNLDKNPRSQTAVSGSGSTPTARESEIIRVRVALPQWLSYKAIEVVSHRAQIGWKQYFRVRNMFPGTIDTHPQTPYAIAQQNIRDGDLHLLRAQIDRREVTPWDRSDDEAAESLFQWGALFAQWSICNYLLDLGFEPVQRLRILSGVSQAIVVDIWGERVQLTKKQSRITWELEDMTYSYISRNEDWDRRWLDPECRKLLTRLDECDSFRIELLSTYDTSTTDFNNMRRLIWHDSSFYSPEFSKQRMHLAVSIACGHRPPQEAPAMIRSVLGIDREGAKDRLEFDICTDVDGMNLLHGLARNIGMACEKGNAREWHGLTRDILAYVTNVKDLHRVSGIDLGISVKGRRIYVFSTVLMRLKLESIEARRLRPRQYGIRSANLDPILSACEDVIMTWLQDLYEAGIGLLQYGEKEKEQFSFEKERITLWCSSSSDAQWLEDASLAAEEKMDLIEPCLINYQYGRLPSEWKFWWSEPSDHFAGDFWDLVEWQNWTPETTIPGAWVD